MDQETIWKRIKVVLAAAMGLMYIVLAFYIIKYEWFLVQLKPPFAYGLGILLILYGLFRIHRVYSSK